MLNIIVTIDYEIFGNGTGDPRQHMTGPLDRILSIFERYSIPITLMFEASEYIKFAQFDRKIRRDKGYSWAKEIKEQVLSTYERGHDVQLHIHPQWHDAHYRDGRWIIPRPNLSPRALPVESLEVMIREGKQHLEELIGSSNKAYSCAVLRLTNLDWQQPPPQAVEAMFNCNIKVHSLSASSYGPPTPQGFWVLDEDRNIIELPIYSRLLRGYRLFTTRRILTGLQSRFSAMRSIAESTSQKRKRPVHLLGTFNKLAKRYPIKWDMCKLSHRELLNFLLSAAKRYDFESREIPLIMIGHTKDFFNPRGLKQFLDKARLIDFVKFTTLAEFLNERLFYI